MAIDTIQETGTAKEGTTGEDLSMLGSTAADRPVTVTSAAAVADRQRRRRRRRLGRNLAIASLGLALPVALGACSNDPLLNPFPKPAPLVIRYADPYFASAAVTAGVVYGTAVDRQGVSINLNADVYQPVGDTEVSRPLVIFVHGGGFTGGSRTAALEAGQADEFARYGFVTTSIDYRLNSLVTAPYDQAATETARATTDAKADLIAAITYFRTNAATYGINPAMISIVGRDAGATVALYANFDSGFNAPANGVRGVVSISGNAPSSIVGLVGAKTAMMHGNNDALVPVTSQQNTCAAATTNGLSCSIVTYPYGHDLDAADAATMAAQTHTAINTFG